MLARAAAEVGRRAMWGVRLGGLAFAVVATVGFVLTMAGGHSHGGLRIVDGAGNEVIANGDAAGTLAAGSFEFQLIGAGGAKHDFVLLPSGEAVDGAAPVRFTTGQEGAPVALVAGNYVLVCGSPGHGDLRYEIRVE